MSPEAFVSAYPKGLDFGARVDSRTSKGRDTSLLGQLLAGPVLNEDAILLAEIDLGEIARAKYDFAVVGHYARPDIFQLHVNEKPVPPVIVD